MGEVRRPRERAMGWAAVAGGVLLGWLGSWGLFVLVVLLVYGVYGVTGGTTSQTVVAIAALLVVPVLSSGALVTRDRRNLGHGLLMGMAIGSIVGSGMCAASVLPGL